jgi:hypothetical protein
LIKLPTLHDVSPLDDLLYEYHDAAIIHVRQHFDESKHQHDVPGFFAGHVRAKLQVLLESESSTYGFTIDTSTGSLIIAYNNFLIKVYKAYNGMIPPPGRDSKTRIRFLNHNGKVHSWPERLPGFEVTADDQDRAKIHLISYYDLTSKYGLAWLKIACPLSVTSAGIDCLWNEFVDNPLAKLQPQKETAQERPDIHITLLKDGMIEEENDLEEDGENTSGLG